MFSSHAPAQIVGIESFQVEGGLHAPTHQHDLLVQHFEELRRVDGLQKAKIILVPESNYAWESQRYGLDIIDRKIPRVYLMAEDEKQQGYRTSQSSKKMMNTLFNRALVAKRIKFHPRLICLSKNGRQEAREALIKEFAQYKRKIIPRSGPQSEYEKPLEIYTGKIGGGTDDLCVAAQINYVAHNIWWNKYTEKYQHLKPLYTSQ